MEISEKRKIEFFENNKKIKVNYIQRTLIKTKERERGVIKVEVLQKGSC